MGTHQKFLSNELVWVPKTYVFMEKYEKYCFIWSFVPLIKSLAHAYSQDTSQTAGIFTLKVPFAWYDMTYSWLLFISNSKGLSEIPREIRTSTYQICRIEEKINRTKTFHKCTCNLTLEVRAISPLFHNILFPVVWFSCLSRDQIFISR